MLEKIFDGNKLKQYYLWNAENAFNTINWEALLQNMEYLSPELAMLFYNCYVIPTRLFIIGGKDIRSYEWVTLRDPTAIVTYAIGISPLRDNLQNIRSGTKYVAIADDLTGAGKLHWIKSWWAVKIVLAKGPKYVYYQNYQNAISWYNINTNKPRKKFFLWPTSTSQ